MSALLAAITEALEGKKTGSGYMCRCPAHDDDRASLSVSAGEKKEIVVCCHAGCAQDAVIDALRARGLWRGNGADTKTRKIAATYDYGDQHGKLVFQVVRYLPKDFRQRRPDGAGGWVWNTRGVTHVPYRLPAVLAAITAGEPVCVVEGEKDVESLARIGLVATCNSGGAGKWRKAHAQWLKGANVTIVPDNDEPGRSHAKQVARSLAGIADARIVELPGLSPKGDVSDWLAAGGTRELLEQLAAGAPKTDDGTDADNRDGKDGKDDRPTVAKVLIDLALKSCDLFHDERADGYAVTMYNGIRRTLKLRGREFRRWLAGSFYAATDRAANNDAISTALSVLEAKATFDGRQLELSNRFAMRDGIIYIDMADTQWRVIKVTADGWEVMDKPPVLFRRYSHQQALPDPVRGGKLSDLHRHFAIKYDDDKLLVEAWLVASAFPNVPCPAIDFHGSQGASKTTTARCLRSLADPSVAESVDLGKSPVELAQVLDHHGVPYFDNVTSIPSWAADMLCRAVTGGAFSKRELYSDDSDILLTFKRPMIITGINIPTHAPDLLDRLLLIELERIPADKRMDEATFWSRFDADRPKLFGSLLDAIAGALRYLPNIKLDRMPRMADFARVACAYAEFAGIGADKMLDVIMLQTSRQTQEVLDCDPVANAIREFIQKRKSWTGTAGELLKLINESAPTPRPDGWPRQGNTLSRKLNVLHGTLNEVGISIRRHKEGQNRERKLTLESSPDSLSASSVSSGSTIHADLGADGRPKSSSRASSAPDDKAHAGKASSASSSALNPSIHAGLDDANDQDDISEPFSGDSDSKSVEVEI